MYNYEQSAAQLSLSSNTITPSLVFKYGWGLIFSLDYLFEKQIVSNKFIKGVQKIENGR